jgi:Tetracyclin repressor-like, C-terminal domain
MASRPPLGPNELTRIERALACLDGLDIETTTALRILMTVTTYVTGSVLNELREIDVEQEQATAGLSQNEIEASMVEWRVRLGR